MAKEPKARPANQFDAPTEPTEAGAAAEQVVKEAAEPSGRAPKGFNRSAAEDRDTALDAAVHWGTTMGKDTGNPQSPQAIVDAAKLFYAFLQASDGRG